SSILCAVSQLTLPEAQPGQPPRCLVKRAGELCLQQIVAHLSDCLLPGPAEKLFGASAPENDPVMKVPRKDRIVGQIEEFRPAEQFRRLLPDPQLQVRLFPKCAFGSVEMKDR